ncbi:hypothetical protein [Limnohabitans sp.]
MKKNGPAFKANGIGSAVGECTENLNRTTVYCTDPFDWWRAVVDFGAGANNGLLIGVISGCDGELVEVFGLLPKLLKKDLNLSDGKRNSDSTIEWLTRPDGNGTRYAVERLSDLLRLLEKREELMQGGAK